MNASVAEKVDTFFAKYSERKYQKGQILIFAGDKPDGIYRIVEGRVKQYDVSYRGDEVVLNVFKPPAFFPMSVAVNDTNNAYFYQAETDVVIRRAPIDETIAFIKDNPDVMFDLLSRVYMGTDGLLGRMSHLMTSSARSRLMYELILECRRFGKQADDGSITISISESDLGNRAGLSRETVNREIRKLKKENLVDMAKSDLKIVNLSELEKRLGIDL